MRRLRQSTTKDQWGRLYLLRDYQSSKIIRASKFIYFLPEQFAVEFHSRLIVKDVMLV